MVLEHTQSWFYFLLTEVKCKQTCLTKRQLQKSLSITFLHLYKINERLRGAFSKKLHSFEKKWAITRLEHVTLSTVCKITKSAYLNFCEKDKGHGTYRHTHTHTQLMAELGGDAGLGLTDDALFIHPALLPVNAIQSNQLWGPGTTHTHTHTQSQRGRCSRGLTRQSQDLIHHDWQKRRRKAKRGEGGGGYERGSGCNKRSGEGVMGIRSWEGCWVGGIEADMQQQWRCTVCIHTS